MEQNVYDRVQTTSLHSRTKTSRQSAFKYFDCVYSQAPEEHAYNLYWEAYFEDADIECMQANKIKNVGSEGDLKYEIMRYLI